MPKIYIHIHIIAKARISFETKQYFKGTLLVNEVEFRY